jgi:DNA-directed RNA polymerase subunit RPC12/RpoP
MKMKTILASYTITLVVGALLLFIVNKSFPIVYVSVIVTWGLVHCIVELLKTIEALKKSLSVEEMNTRCATYFLNRAEKRLAETLYRCSACKRFIGKGKEHLLGEKVLCEECATKKREHK